MGLETIAIGASIAMSVAATAYSLIVGSKAKNKLKRGNLGDLQVTQAQEGSVIPVCYGTVKIAGNIVWYGNMQQKNKSVGAKGGGSAVSDNVETKIDVHEIIAYGIYTLNGIYKDDELHTPDADVVYNDDELEYDTYSSGFKGLSHIYFRNWNLGVNNLTVPSLQFSITRDISHVPAFANVPCTNGCNPATIIYDLLILSGFTDADMDQTSFNVSATYWAHIDWGLNFILSEQKDLSEVIKDIFSQTPGSLYKNEDGKFVLRYFGGYESPTFTLDYREISDFSLSRESCQSLTSDFVANFIDSNFVERTCRMSNEAVARLIGRKTTSVELKGFNENNVSARLSEILKINSYPLCSIKMKVPLYYNQYVAPGVIFAMEYPAWNMVEKEFRIETCKKLSEELAIEIEGKEYTNNLIDAYAQIGIHHIDNYIEKTPVTLDYKHAIKMFKYSAYPNNALLLLAERKLGIERTFDIYWSSDGLVYRFGGNYSGFSFHGVLDVDYTDETNDIDDTIGATIEFAASIDTSYLSSLTRPELFTTNRFLVIGDELVKFQTATSLGVNKYKLLGILRKDKEEHLIGEDCYVGIIDENVITSIPSKGPIYLKFLPRTWWEVLDDDTAINIDYEFKPEKISRLCCTRSGSDVSVEIVPNTQSVEYGYGIGDPDDVIDPEHPMPINGQILVSKDSGTYTVQTSTLYNISDANAFTLAVKHRFNGKESDIVSVSVGTDDGIYLGV